MRLRGYTEVLWPTGAENFVDQAPVQNSDADYKLGSELLCPLSSSASSLSL
jgi:hypothetical protein